MPLHVAQQTREILRKTVTHGTGRRARGELFVESSGLLDDAEPTTSSQRMRVPAFGKTGTTNNFLTSYFAGFLPYPSKKQQDLDVKDSLVVATYIGYDLNRSMRNGRQRIYGGKGALPVWTDFLKDFIKLHNFDQFVDPVDISFMARKEWPLQTEPGTESYLVDLPRGVILRSAGSEDIEIWKMTNFAVTGEEYQDLFAINAKTSSILNLKPDPFASALQPLRVFSLFDKTNSEMDDEFWHQSATKDDLEEYEF